jgi:vanillate O-demethylase monooxygenase subunit
MPEQSFVANTWYVAGFSEDFPVMKLTGQTIAAKPIVIWRSAEGQVVAFDGRCVHKRMPLKDGRLLPDGTVECAYHGFCFNASGKCVRIPSQPDGAIPSRATLRPFPVIEQDGLVWIWPGNSEKIGVVKPPRTPEIGSGEWKSVHGDAMTVPANYRLLIENLLDITHFYPLHNGNVGDLAQSLLHIDIVEETVDGNPSVKTIRHAHNYEQPPFLADWFGYQVVDRVHTHALQSPGVTRVQMTVAPPGQLGTDKDRGYVLHHLHTPINARSHVWRWSISCLSDHKSTSNPEQSLADAIAANFPEVVAQDLWALERQQEMFELPDNGYEECNVRSDRALLIGRKILARLESEEAAAQV